MEPGVRKRLEPALDRIQRFVADGEVDGAGLAVAERGEQVAEWYAGHARPGLAAGPEVLWPLASISKVYTATAVMALVERGDLTLRTPVSSILPAFTGEGRERVLVGHLLTHTSGLIYESPDMAGLLARQTPLDEIVNEAYTHPLLFTPGERIQYSDFGYGLAGRVVAAVTSKSFPEAMRALVLAPGGLRETFMPPAPHDEPRVAYVTGVLAEGTEGAMYNSSYALQLAHPAFGTVASVSDLLRFGLLFAPDGRRRILSEAGVRAMTTDQTGGGLRMNLIGIEPETPQSWGMGFMVRGPADPQGFFGDLCPPGTFGHDGASGCVLAVNPVDGITVAFVSNRHANAGLDAFLHRIAVVLNTVMAAMTRRP